MIEERCQQEVQTRSMHEEATHELDKVQSAIDECDAYLQSDEVNSIAQGQSNKARNTEVSYYEDSYSGKQSGGRQSGNAHSRLGGFSNKQTLYDPPSSSTHRIGSSGRRVVSISSVPSREVQIHQQSRAVKLRSQVAGVHRASSQPVQASEENKPSIHDLKRTKHDSDVDDKFEQYRHETIEKSSA